MDISSLITNPEACEGNFGFIGQYNVGGVTAGADWNSLETHIKQLFPDLPNAFLGRYWDNNRYYFYIQLGEMRWKVLSIKQNAILVVANDWDEPYAEYNGFREFDKKQAVWQKSAIRKYLNTKFLKQFSKLEMTKIAFTSCENRDFLQDCYEVPEIHFKSDSSCRTEPENMSTTIDQIFLLSINEWLTYLDSEPPVEASFWLRSRGLGKNHVAYISKGKLVDHGLFLLLSPNDRHYPMKTGVRPAMWITPNAANSTRNPVHTFSLSLKQIYQLRALSGKAKAEMQAQFELKQAEQKASEQERVRLKAKQLADRYFSE